MIDRFRGCLLGLAVGDALGAQVEFSEPGTFPPVTRMEGGGPFNLQPGEWTDDTSMALCLAESLLERSGFDAHDQMTRYVSWWREGHLSSTGECFDIGNTVRGSLGRFLRTGDPFAGPDDPATAGNGSLMRLAPVPMFYAADPETAIARAAESSRTTHGAAEAIDRCVRFARILADALHGASKTELLRGVPVTSRPRSSGHVVDTFDAALWAFATTGGFREALLAAVNLGGDADTVGAVCGQLAGAHYGERSIPREWLEPLAMRRYIDDQAARLYSAAFPSRPG